MNSSDLVLAKRCAALYAGCTGPAGPAGPGVAPLFGAFLSMSDQHPNLANPSTVPVAITFSSRTEGTINVSGGAYPGSQIIIPTAGTYRFLFSAQLISTGSHWLEIWPVINGTSLSNSNTRFRVPSNTETCLTVEYFYTFAANDVLQLYLRGDDYDVHLVTLAGNGATTPVVPAIPSIILTVQRIA